MIKRFVVAATTLALAAALLSVAPQASEAAEASPYCGITWGSNPKVAGPSTSPFSPLANIRVGRHDCFDRMVFDLGGAAPGYDVRYVTHVRTVGKGDILPLGGGARFEITLHAPDHRPNGRITYPAVIGRRLPNVDTTGFRTFRNARYGGSFEGVTIVGLSVRARLPFRVVKQGNKLVIDVAHQWSN